MRKLAAFRKLSSPFIGDKPLDSISLCFYGDSTGIKMWNNPNDPMPIKTTNMAGLQKWEETDDYIIYLCKDATMTVVQNYVTGTFQEFKEIKALIEASQELMKSYAIEWSAQDSIDLINEINNEALAKLEATPMLLTENGDNETQVLSARTVPVTYECCFRMDKKSGEFYIGEGYENLFSSARNWANVVDVVETTGNATEGWYTTKWIGANRTDSFNPFVTNVLTVNSGDVFSFNFKCKTDYKINMVGLTVNGADGQFSSDLNSITASTSTTNRHLTLRYQQIAFTQGWQETVYNICITKTSTPKPFVKSIMPSGKLAFVTEANETTHTFLAKKELSFNESTILKTVLGATSNPVLTIEETETVNWIGGTTNEI